MSKIQRKMVISKNKKSNIKRPVIKKKIKKIKPKTVSKSKSGSKNATKAKEDDFLINEIEREDDETSEIPSEPSDEDNLEEELAKEESDEEINSDEENEEGFENSNFDDVELHKQSLANLKKSDPEFYKFLEENDKKLLNFQNSDDEEEEGSEKDEDVHIPDDNLEVASDESDFERDDEEKPKDERIITLKLLKKWQNEIKTDKSNKTLNSVVQAFHAALVRVSPDDEQETCVYKVEGSSVFNAVIQLCVLEFGPAIRKFLGLTATSKQQPHKCKKFVKVKKLLKSYFEDLLKLLSGVASPNIQTVLLKHLHYMSSMLISYPNITKSLLKRLITIWGTADEGVRVVAFFCILRIARNDLAANLDPVLKSMYMTYVKNSKFVGVSTLASINFMRRSLVEMFALDLSHSYQHVFLYIRQLAIHLRNAISNKKKENTQAVYNWQFVNSLKLWGNLLGVTCDKPQLQQLVYPFVQVCLGCLRLVPTNQYYPLRFHLTRVLIDLSKDAGVFVPVLPFLVEILNIYDFNKKHQKVSMKPLQFTCLLRLSKSQLLENGFKDTLIDTIYSQLLDYMTQQSHAIAYPELSVVPRMQVRQFLKKCKNANYNRKMKQLLDKLEQNAEFIENERKKITIKLTDLKQIEGWESRMKNNGTPLSIYYESWIKVRNQKKRKEISNNEELGDYKLPALKKTKVAKKIVEEKENGPVELFPSNSESEGEVEEDVKRKRGKRGGKGGKGNKTTDHSGPVKDDNGKEDIVEDINIDDW